MGLLGGEIVDGGEHGGVDGAGVEEEAADDFLEEFGVCWG